MNSHMLVTHRDIQNWVNAMKGRPALRRVADTTGRMRARLALNFDHPQALTETPSQDDGMSPCSWTAWLAELDRQHLALKVADRDKPRFEFVERQDLH